MNTRFGIVKKTLVCIAVVMVVAFSYKLYFAPTNNSSDEFLAENRSRLNSYQQKPQAPRDYSAKLSETEKKDISYIITTLANSSYMSLAFKEGSLKQAGNRIENVHPLKLLQYIFSDPKLKKSVKRVQGTPWRRFVSDTARSLDKEAQLGNMKESYLKEYSDAVGVNEGLLNSSVQNNNWEEFINVTRNNLPSN